MFNPDNLALQSKYKVTGLLYDILDYPWERLYRHWRPELVRDMKGAVLEAGVGTGRNLSYYSADVNLTAIDLSSTMLLKARTRSKMAKCSIHFVHEDATIMSSIASEQFDWLLSTFMCCVMPDHLQSQAISHFERVLKPGGRFRILEMVYSKDPQKRRKQKWLAPLVEKIYGARFDRNTLGYLNRSEQLEVLSTQYLKDDTYLLIEGIRKCH